MRTLHKSWLIIILAGTFASFSMGALYRIRNEPIVRSEFLMGTLIEITAYGKKAEPAIEAAFLRIREIEAQIGRNEFSDISRLNAYSGGSFIAVSNDTWRMLSMAVQYCKTTDGAFDVTVNPLVELWGFGYDGKGHFPEPGIINATLPKVGSDKLILSPINRRVKLIKTGMSITVGGIAKGYAVEEAIKVLMSKGIKKAMVNGTSSIKVIGSGPANRGWRIGIEDPRHEGKLLGVITLKSGESIGTSADNKHFFIKNGKRYSHIIDPRTGYPTARGISMAAVITRDATKADILTKALFLNDSDWSFRFLKQHRIQAILVDVQGKIRKTPGLELN